MPRENAFFFVFFFDVVINVWKSEMATLTEVYRVVRAMTVVNLTSPRVILKPKLTKRYFEN